MLLNSIDFSKPNDNVTMLVMLKATPRSTAPSEYCIDLVEQTETLGLVDDQDMPEELSSDDLAEEEGYVVLPQLESIFLLRRCALLWGFYD